MTDTPRTSSYLIGTSFATNAGTGAIKSQQLRDFVLSVPVDGGTFNGTIAGSPVWTGAHMFAAGFSEPIGTVTYSGALTATNEFTAILAGATTSSNAGVADYTITDGAKTNGTGPISYLKVTTTNGGSNFNGGRNALSSTINYTGNTGNKSAGLQGFQTAIYANVNVTGNDNGTATTIGNCQGSFCGINPSMIVTSGATNLAEITGAEFDLSIGSGASVSQASHLLLVNSTGHAVRGSNEDTFVQMSGGTDGVMTKQVGIQFGSSFSEWPFTTDSTLLKCEISQDPLATPADALCGLDGCVVTWSDTFLRSRQFSVDNNGSAQIGQGVLSAISSGVQLDSSGSIGPAENATISGGNIVSGGTGNTATLWWRDAYGGLYRSGAASGGAVTSLTVYRQPFVKGTPPSNPITLTPIGVTQARGGSALTINVTWTAGTTVALNPSGVVTAPTASKGDNSANVATTAFVQSAVSGVSFQAYISTAQTVSGATSTKAAFDTIVFDTGSYYDNTTNYRYTPLVAGKYKVTAAIQLIAASGATSGGSNYTEILKNGTSYARTRFVAPNATGSDTTLICTAIIQMNGSTDYLEAWGTVAASTGTIEFAGGSAPMLSWFEANWIGP